MQLKISKKIQIALDKIDWRKSLAIGNKDINNSFQIFLQTIEILLNTFCTVTTISKRKQNLKLKQASAYEACNCTCMPLHAPKTEMCKKNKPCLIQKASRCVSKTKLFIFHFLYNTKIL